MKYRRKWDCAVCGGEVILDTETKKLTCACGEAENPHYTENYRYLLRSFVRVDLNKPEKDKPRGALW